MKKKLLCLLAGLFLLFASPAYAQEQTGQLLSMLPGTNPPGACVQEMPLGSMAADAVLACCGGDVVILNGGDITGNLQAGEIRKTDLQVAFSRERELVKLTVSREDILSLLEQGFSLVSVGADDRVDVSASIYEGFPQVAGMNVVFDASCQPGERVQSLEILSASEKDTFTLICTRYMAEGGYGYPRLEDYESCGETLLSALEEYCLGRIVQPLEEGRIRMIGTADDTLLKDFPKGIFILVAVALAVLALLKPKRPYLND